MTPNRRAPHALASLDRRAPQALASLERRAPHANASLNRHALYALALLLAAVAGGVDALGWMLLGNVFTAHMSGNTVGLTVYLAMGDWAEVAKRVAVIVYFVAGLAAGAAFATIAYHRRSRSGFFWALGTEAGMLFALLVAGEVLGRGASGALSPTGRYFALLALPALAMGIQSATLRRIEPVHARTTYVTGVLTRFVESLVVWAAHAIERRRHPDPADRDMTEQTAKKRAAVLASLWTAYASGGVASALLARRIAIQAFALPLGLLLVAILLDRGLARAGIAEAGPEEG